MTKPNKNLHAGHVSKQMSDRFQWQIKWLRSSETGPGLSLGQIAREIDLKDGMSTDDRPSEVMQKVIASRSQAEWLVKRVERLYSKYKKKERARTDSFHRSPGHRVPSEDYETRIKNALAEKPMQVSELYTTATGSPNNLRKALERLIEIGEVTVEGRWPPKPGGKTLLSITRVVQPKTKEPPPTTQAQAGPSLSDARANIQSAIKNLESISENGFKNLTKAAKELVTQEYEAHITELQHILDQLEE